MSHPRGAGCIKVVTSLAFASSGNVTTRTNEPVMKTTTMWIICALSLVGMSPSWLSVCAAESQNGKQPSREQIRGKFEQGSQIKSGKKNKQKSASENAGNSNARKKKSKDGIKASSSRRQAVRSQKEDPRPAVASRKGGGRERRKEREALKPGTSNGRKSTDRDPVFSSRGRQQDRSNRLSADKPRGVKQDKKLSEPKRQSMWDHRSQTSYRSRKRGLAQKNQGNRQYNYPRGDRGFGPMADRGGRASGIAGRGNRRPAARENDKPLEEKERMGMESRGMRPRGMRPRGMRPRGMRPRDSSMRGTNRMNRPDAPQDPDVHERPHRRVSGPDQGSRGRENLGNRERADWDERPSKGHPQRSPRDRGEESNHDREEAAAKESLI